MFQASGLPVPEGVHVAEGKDEFGRFLPLTVVGKDPDSGRLAPRLVAFRKAAELLEREPEPIGDVWGGPVGGGCGGFNRRRHRSGTRRNADGRVRIAFFDRTLLGPQQGRVLHVSDAPT